MKRVLITACLLALASIGLATVAEAVQTVKDPFVHVAPSTYNLDLGTAAASGYHTVNKVLKLRVESNCFHGPIKVSSTEFRGKLGGSIQPDRIFVRSKATWGFVPMDKPVAVSRPQSGSHDIILDMQVETGFHDHAGQYRGTITVTIMPPV